MYACVRLLWLHFGEGLGPEASMDLGDPLRGSVIIQERDDGRLHCSADGGGGEK